MGWNWPSFLQNQDFIGPILTMFFTILVIEWLLPRFKNKKETAQRKLKEFYNLAYAFIAIREKFAITINREEHNEDNCGYFHNFNIIDNISNGIFNEGEFFKMVSERMDILDDELRDCFIDYFKRRGPDSVIKKLSCKDKELIKLKKKIEKEIINGYKKYKN